jgi:hypothetical protein
LDGTGVETVILSDEACPFTLTGQSGPLAFDPVDVKLFFGWWQGAGICRINTDGSAPETIVETEEALLPRGSAIDIVGRDLLYFSDMTTFGGPLHIRRARLDGSASPHSIYEAPGDVGVLGSLSIDHSTRKLYWAEPTDLVGSGAPSIIKRANLDGGGVEIVAELPVEAVGIFVVGAPVSGATTMTMLSPSAHVLVFGEPLTLTATVTSEGGVPTGMVEFFADAVSLGSATLSSGVAQLEVASLSIGIHSVSAVYAGDGSFLPSSSAAVQVEVVPIPPPGDQVDLGIGSLTASPDPVQSGGMVTYTVRIDNLGPGASTGSRVRVTGAAPWPMRFVRATGVACTAEGQSLECEVGSIPSTGNAVFSLSFQHLVPAAPVRRVAPIGSLTVGFEVFGNEPDSNTSNNTASLTTSVDFRR